MFRINHPISSTNYIGMIFVFVFNLFQRIIKSVCVAQKIVAIIYTHISYYIHKKIIKNICNLHLISDYLP